MESESVFEAKPPPNSPTPPKRVAVIFCFLTQERGFQNSKMMEHVKIVNSNSERAMLKPMIGKREG